MTPKPVRFSNLKARVRYNSTSQDVTVLSNIPYVPILSDPSLAAYVNFDFGYLRLSFAKDCEFIRFTTNSTSSNKLIVLKRACTVVSNFVTYATLDKVLLHRCVLWSSAKSKALELKRLKHEVADHSLDLKAYALKTFPEHTTEILELGCQLRSLHTSMLRLAVKLHLASGSKDTNYLNGPTHKTLLQLKGHL